MKAVLLIPPFKSSVMWFHDSGILDRVFSLRMARNWCIRFVEKEKRCWNNFVCEL